MNRHAFYLILCVCLVGLGLAFLNMSVMAYAPHGFTSTSAVTVNNNSDIDHQPCDGAGLCSLRSALTKSRSDPAYEFYITFDNDYDIQLTRPLTVTRDHVYILADGSNSTAVHNIRIDAHDNGQAFIISGVGDILGGLRIYGSGSGASNVWIQHPASEVILRNNVIGDSSPSDGCETSSLHSYSGIYINTAINPPTGKYNAYIYGNTIQCNFGSPGDGIDIYSNKIRVGDPGWAITTPAYNMIRNNTGQGIYVNDSTGDIIGPNRIGVGNSGNSASGNGGAGIYLDTSSSSSVITGNLVSGNNSSGIVLNGADTISITRNMIGTNLAGTTDLPNFGEGISLTNHADNNVIGFDNFNIPISPQPNLISGNVSCGINVSGNSTGNWIEANVIGLNALGNLAIPNMAGICVYQASGNWIGTASEAGKQTISGNRYQGIYIQDSNSTTVGGNNNIGVGTDGHTPLGNDREGLLVNGSSNCRITPGKVMFNGRAGMALVGSSVTNVSLKAHSVYGNGGLPVDLGNDGPTPNHPGGGGTGPNGLLNYPEITSWSSTTVTGTVGSTCPGCLVNVYQAVGNPAAAGGGGVFLFYTYADSLGNFSFTLPITLTRFGVTLQTGQSSLLIQSPQSGYEINSELSPRPVLFLPRIVR